MPHRLIRRAALAPFACALTIGLATGGVAQASDAGLRAAVRQGVPALEHAQAKIINGVATYQKTHSAAALIKAFGAQDRALKSFKTHVAAITPSSATGRRARTDLVNGLNLILASNVTLLTQIEKKASGQAVSKAQVKAATKADLKGNLDLANGIKLLKV